MIAVTIDLNTNSQLPLYEQIYSFIKSEIMQGKIKKGEKLPSKRVLAQHLQCSINTVESAYSQLAAEGYIYSRPKSGFFACTLEGVLSMQSLPAQGGAPARADKILFDFSHSGVDSESFPFAKWRRLSKEAVDEFDPLLFKTGDPRGSHELRSAIASYLHSSRGVNCDPSQIVVSCGTEYLFQLLIRLFAPETLYALENPGYEKLNMIFKSNHVCYKAVALDTQGLDPLLLQKSGADIVCVTPSHQFPTGVIMPVSRRLALLRWAADKDGRYIIEDDYDSEFKFSGRPIPSLQSLGGDKVIYLGAFSKSLSPSMRVSYMVLPPALIKAYLQSLTFYICPVPALQQKTLTAFMTGGDFERHLNRMRGIYKRKRERLVSELAKSFEKGQVIGANAGLHLVFKPNTGKSERELVDSARDFGVKVYGLSKYYIEQPKETSAPSVLLGFASLSEEQMKKAVALLATAWK